ncbi:MAG: citrate/2-methylcitrate synthase [Anaerolineales bacterium]|nr:citrate/2-methylcitrate synthase [Anaerolineales bacterium]
MSDAGKGLAGVVVADTTKSKVDGENGHLYYVGYTIEDLAANATFEETTFLLWNNRLPSQAELSEFSDTVKAEMEVPAAIIDVMKSLPSNAHPMGVLRTAVSMLGNYDPEADDNSMDANHRKALRLLAKMPTLTAAWARIRKGQEPVAPRKDLGLAANFMYMLNDREPTETEIQAINVYLVLLADHGFNASTFTSRVVTSTDGDIYSAVAAAIGSLKGPKHGGANEAAMKMFMEIGDPAKVDEFFTKRVKGEGYKIMGIGHRVYKAPDPRGGILHVHAKALAESTGNAAWYEVAKRLEDLARADEYFIERKLYANVDYYSSIVLYTVGIEPDMMTCLFAMSRIAGWAAHIIEQWGDNRLIRPKANYTGEINVPWVPLEER